MAKTPKNETAPAPETTDQPAPDASTTAPAAAPTGEKPKREGKAEHILLNPAGEVVEGQHEATGIRYVDKATGKVFNYQVPGAYAGSVLTMLAIFGAKTLATNTASANRNGKPGEVVIDDVAAIEDRFGGERLKEGQWDVSGEGTARGPRWDLPVLASVIVDALAASGKTVELDKVVAKLESDNAYRRGAMAHTGFRAEYFKRKGVADPDLSTFAV